MYIALYYAMSLKRSVVSNIEAKWRSRPICRSFINSCLSKISLLKLRLWPPNLRYTIYLRAVLTRKNRKKDALSVKRKAFRHTYVGRPGNKENHQNIGWQDLQYTVRQAAYTHF